MVNNVFELSSIEELENKSSEIQGVVSARGYVLLRGLFDRNLIRDKIDGISSYIGQSDIYPSSGVKREEIRENIVKYSIGSTSGSQSGISRFFLTIMNPMDKDDVLGMKDIFHNLISVRDTIAQRKPILFDENLPKPKFNGTRVQAYPSGGGFMTSHRDTRAAHSLEGTATNYIQLVMLLTEKGTDYHSGGAFVEHNGKIIDSERGSFSGDILVYDGNTNHGVADIDPHIALDTRNFKGRFVAVATIYD